MMLLLKVTIFVSLMSAVIGVNHGNEISAKCADYWTSYGGHCYRFYRNQHSWGSARSYCQTVHAELVSINSEDENKFISYLSSGSSESPVRGPPLWIGLGPEFHAQRKKKWLDGSWMMYSIWEAGEPNNNGGHEGCVETNWNIRGEWNDKPCYHLQPFICERSGEKS